jgi:hypothetical protein
VWLFSCHYIYFIIKVVDVFDAYLHNETIIFVPLYLFYYQVVVVFDEYFHNETPETIINGITGTEYNIVKGAIAGPVLIVTGTYILLPHDKTSIIKPYVAHSPCSRHSAPFTGALEGATASDSFLDGTGAFCTGFGRGIVRGVVGGTGKDTWLVFRGLYIL